MYFWNRNNYKQKIIVSLTTKKFIIFFENM